MAKRTMPSPMSQDEFCHVSVRRIDNGFIVSESRSGPKGYTSRETYHPKKPNITMGDQGTVGGKGAEKNPGPNRNQAAVRRAAGAKRK